MPAHNIRTFFSQLLRAPTEFVACCLRHSFQLSRSRLGCCAKKCTFRTSRRLDRSEAGCGPRSQAALSRRMQRADEYIDIICQRACGELAADGVLTALL